MAYPELEKCINVIKELRHPKTGCPWDLEQTHKTLLKYLLEESYEFMEATQAEDYKAMEEELGDVLLQVILHSTIAEEARGFDIESVARTLSDKIIRRHPHVFGERPSNISSDEVVANWQQIKKAEKGEKKHTFDQKLLHAPALESAFKIGKKSTSVNFDWEDHLQVIGKVEEEWQEVKEELPPTGAFNKDRVKEEIGDLLFSMAQLARHLDLNPEECLIDANKKFLNRIQKVEDLVTASGKSMNEVSQDQLEKFWIQVKRNDKVKR